VYRRAIRKSKENIAHAEMMIRYYKSEQEVELDKKKHGEMGLKISQLEDNHDAEVTFLNKFIALS
jgi:hypothetical protein